MSALRIALPMWQARAGEPASTGGGFIAGHLNLEVAYRVAACVVFCTESDPERFAALLPELYGATNVADLASCITHDLAVTLMPYGPLQDLSGMARDVVFALRRLLRASFEEEASR